MRKAFCGMRIRKTRGKAPHFAEEGKKMVYRVEVAGRIFEGTDHRELIKLAVQARLNAGKAQWPWETVAAPPTSLKLQPTERAACA